MAVGFGAWFLLYYRCINRVKREPLITLIHVMGCDWVLVSWWRCGDVCGCLVCRPLAAPGPHPNPLPPSGLCSKSPFIMRLLEQLGILFQKSTEIVVADRTKRRPSSCGTGRNNWELLTKVTKPSIQSRLTQSHLIEFSQIGHGGSVSPSRRSISTK